MGEYVSVGGGKGECVSKTACQWVSGRVSV